MGLGNGSGAPDEDATVEALARDVAQRVVPDDATPGRVDAVAQAVAEALPALAQARGALPETV